ncbi:MAG: LPS export ABC transporter ATP-binding protein [Armatimonadota bacterium]|nr:MAG: LPS export ABC transporter ATP-binding protein [Armatimonadota bacterium]
MAKADIKLVTEELVKIYRRRRVVDGVSLEVKPGEIVGLLVPNGAGKTTTFYMVVGLVRPDGGGVRLDGRDIGRVPMYRRARMGIGYLSQEPSIFRKLSVEDNLRAVLEMQATPHGEREDRINRLLDELHIADLRNSMAYVLSGGERRRVEIARALATDPTFILLDEPFTGIDPIAIDDIRDILGSLKARGIGILLTDHSVRDTLAVTDRSYIIYQGRILTQGTSSELLSDPVARKFYLGERFEM